MDPSSLIPETEKLHRAVRAHLEELFGSAPSFGLHFVAQRWLVAYFDPTAHPADPPDVREVLAHIRLDPSTETGLVFDVL